MLLTQAEARAAGLTIDTHCYPNVAYSGDRFAPAHICEVMTEREADTVAALEKARNRIAQLEIARQIDTLTTSHYVANVALKGLWGMLGASNQTEACDRLRALIDMLQSYADSGVMIPSERALFERLKKGLTP